MSEPLAAFQDPPDDPVLADVLRYAVDHPSPWPLSIRAVIEGCTFDPPPWNIVKGPLKDRRGPAGLLVVGGKRLVGWGDPAEAEMVFSVTKSYLGLVAAMALDEGRIPDFDEPVARRVDHPAFGAPNDGVTWRHLLQQTSEWRGSLWGIPDTVDRNRQLSPTEDGSRFGTTTPYGPPGSTWDYNDIRVNALCLALTIVFGSSLRAVLQSRFMAHAGPGAWDWTGYDDGVVTIGEGAEPVVVGGGHWGGGLVVSATQDASLGRLVVGGGVLDGRRIVSEAALAEILTPCALQPVYGGLWWLNTGRALFPQAPETSVFALGVGTNAIWVDRPRDIVLVVHGLAPDSLGGLIERVLRAVPDRTF